MCSRYDVCEAYYMYAANYHRGQWSPEYAILGRLQRMGFCARIGLMNRKDLTDEGKRIYDRLVRRRPR
jgi:hypothetical protein